MLLGAIDLYGVPERRAGGKNGNIISFPQWPDIAESVRPFREMAIALSRRPTTSLGAGAGEDGEAVPRALALPPRPLRHQGRLVRRRQPPAARRVQHIQRPMGGDRSERLPRPHGRRVRPPAPPLSRGSARPCSPMRRAAQGQEPVEQDHRPQHRAPRQKAARRRQRAEGARTGRGGGRPGRGHEGRPHRAGRGPRPRLLHGADRRRARRRPGEAPRQPAPDRRRIRRQPAAGRTARPARGAGGKRSGARPPGRIRPGGEGRVRRAPGQARLNELSPAKLFAPRARNLRETRWFWGRRWLAKVYHSGKSSTVGQFSNEAAGQNALDRALGRFSGAQQARARPGQKACCVCGGLFVHNPEQPGARPPARVTHTAPGTTNKRCVPEPG